MDKAVPDGVKSYQTKLLHALDSLASSKKAGGMASIVQELTLKTTPVSDASSIPKENPKMDWEPFVEFIKTSHVGIAILSIVLLLIVSNILGLFFLLHVNSKVNLLLLQPPPAPPHNEL